MSISGIKPAHAGRNPQVGRYVLGAVLLVALALVLSAADTREALAQVGFQANTNYVSNGSFEKDSNGDGLPNSWLAGALGAGDKRVCNQSVAGSCSFKMVGDGSLKSIYQIIPLTNPNVGDEFKLKVWTKGKALDLSGGQARIIVRFFDGGFLGNSASLDIPSGTSAWTLRQVSVTAAADYDEIWIFVQLDANSGKAWFDKVSLVYVGAP